MLVSHEQLIAAPPDVVWGVTIDVERWPDWAPTVSRVTRRDGGPLRVGSVARVVQPGQPASDWTVVELVAGERFVWKTRRRGLLMVAVHQLRADRAGTRNTLQLEATGPLAALLWPVLRLAVPRALAAENRGLASRCEAVADQGSV